MNFLVTGATGFIGTNVVEQLLEAGHRVVAFSNQPVPDKAANRWRELAGELVFVQGDVRDTELLKREMRQHAVRRVLHGAAVTSDSEREKRNGALVLDINLAGTASVTAAAGETGVEKFVYLGSAGVYSEELQPDGTLLTEDVPHLVSTLYGISKSAAEGIVSRIATLWDMPFAIGRIGTAFGPWEHETGFRDTMSPMFQMTRLAFQGKRADIPFDKNKNWHYSRDAAAALITLATKATVHPVYNLGPSAVWSLSEWAGLLEQRFPKFQFQISKPGNVEVYGQAHGGRLSWQRFETEFGATARYGLSAAFNDYLKWLQQSQLFE